MSKEKDKEKFERVEKVLEDVASLPGDAKSFIFGYMVRVNEEQEKKKEVAKVG